MSKKKAISKVQENDNNDNVQPIDKSSDKYKVALKFVNLILSNINKPTVTDLCDFKEIDREDIIKEVNKVSLDEIAEELFGFFNKKNSGYYRKTDAIVLNCLRGIMKEAGYELVKTQKERSEEINGKMFRRSHMIYHIK